MFSIDLCFLRDGISVGWMEDRGVYGGKIGVFMEGRENGDSGYLVGIEIVHPVGLFSVLGEVHCLISERADPLQPNIGLLFRGVFGLGIDRCVPATPG